MNKTDLINAVSKKTGSSKKATKLLINTFTETVAQALSNQNRVILVGFGTWNVIKVSSRTGRNPRTGEPIQIHAKRKVRFKAGAELSDKVN